MEAVNSTKQHQQLVAAVGTEGARYFAGSEVYEVAATRLRDLEGILARSMVIGADRCAIVVPQLSRKTAEQLKAFIEDHLWAGLALLIVSKAGGSIRRLADNREVHIRPDTKSRKSTNSGSGTPTAARDALVFSDATSWLVKILLLQNVDDHLWAGPKGPFRSIAGLAERAGVAYSAAHKTVSTLRSRGWLSRSGELHIIAARELLEAWLATITLDPPPQAPVRGLIGTLRQQPRSNRALAQALGGIADDDPASRWALSGWSAIEVLKLGHVVGNKSYSITTGQSLEQALDRWSLQVVSPQDATFWLRPQGSKRSTFSGSMQTRAGFPVVDALQAALDVSTDANRGREQAWHILETLLPTAWA